MLTKSFADVYLDGLNNLGKEIGLYENEADLWLIEEGINNSAGNLALHLIGNLNYFIGDRLGHTGYIREREKEFTEKNVPKEKLLSDIEKLKVMVPEVLTALPDAELDKEFGTNPFGPDKTTQYILVYFLGHLNYHLGQINYHRRLLAKKS